MSLLFILKIFQDVIVDWDCAKNEELNIFVQYTPVGIFPFKAAGKELNQGIESVQR